MTGFKNIFGDERIQAPLFQTGNTTFSAVLTDLFFGTGLGGEIVIEDISLDLSAYYQKFENINTYLRAHDGIELHDLKTELSTWGLVEEDLLSWLAAYYESMDDFGTSLETWATGYKNLAGEFDVKGQKIESFLAYLSVAKEKFKNLAMFLYAVNGIVLRDMRAYLATTNGIVAKDFGMCLQAIGVVPAFISVTAHRVNSVIHEVA